MKTVAVIVAARDAGPWLQQSLYSIATQKLPRHWRLRICLGIDACPSTWRAANQLQVPGLQITYFPEHVGPFVIFNSLACVEEADVLVRFDADDVMLDGYIASQLDILQATPNSLITQTWSIYVNESLQPRRAQLANGRFTASDGRRSQGSDGQFAMTASVWERLGSFRAWWCHADSDFLRRAHWARIAKIEVPQYLYLRRMHAGSLTQSRATGYISSWRKYYAMQIADQVKQYSRGKSPERVLPSVARRIGTQVSWPQVYE